MIMDLELEVVESPDFLQVLLDNEVKTDVENVNLATRFSELNMYQGDYWATTRYYLNSVKAIYDLEDLDEYRDVIRNDITNLHLIKDRDVNLFFKILDSVIKYYNLK